MVDVEARDRVDVIRQSQPVGRQTQLDVRRRPRDQIEGLEGLFRIGQRIARTRDAQHRHLRNGRGHRQNFLRRLLGRELLAHHAGARLIGAIIFAVAVIALDVARRRDRHMHARVMMMRFLAVAGMVLDLLPDIRRQIALARGRAATRLAAAARGAAALVLGDLLHDPVDRRRRPRLLNKLHRVHVEFPLCRRLAQMPALSANTSAKTRPPRISAKTHRP